jgi:hypothetical protein
MRGTRLQFDPLKASSLMWSTLSHLSLLGQSPFGWPAPNGYPDSNGKWMSAGALVSRWNMASNAAVGFWMGAPSFDPTRLVATTPATLGEAVDRLGQAVLCTPLDPASRAAIISATGMRETDPWRSWYNHRGLLSYILQSPVNQVR